MNHKHILFLITLLFTGIVIGQTPFPNAGSIHIDGQINGAENKKVMLVSKNFGGLEHPVGSSMADGEGKFAIDTIIPVQDYYFLRLESGQMLNLVLYPGDKLTINGNATDLLSSFQIIGSPNSKLLNEFFLKQVRFKQVEDSLKTVLKAAPQKQGEVNAYFSPVAQEFYNYRNSFVNSNSASPAVIGPLGTVDQKKEWDAYKQLVKMLMGSFSDSPTIQELARYIGQKDAQMTQMAAANAQKEELFKPGNVVPEIEMPDMQGNMLKLSSLRGKVVLIDFWASWCGPCRKENPNVVKAYQHYNSHGFEVFSVSLDKKGAREKWLAAIAKDGLVWPSHVCSLEGFATKAAQDYFVNSIPFTVLIDAEGKVIATNLRGPRLDAELKRIFGH